MSQFDETVDFIVVGSGGAALSGALKMSACGKQVVVLEKSDLVGGTTARSGGVMWIPNNRFLKRDGIEDSFEQAKLYLDTLAAEERQAPGSTPQRRDQFLRKAPEMIDFLVEQGIKLDRVPYWPDYYDEKPGGLEVGRCVVAEVFDTNELGEWRDRLRPGFLPMPAKLSEALMIGAVKVSWQAKKVFFRVACKVVWSKLKGKRFTSAGAALQGRMLQALLKLGVDIRPRSPVSELIIESGEVKGVVTEKAGRPWRVAATAGVLVGAGGFAHNQAMRDKYIPGTSTRWTSAAPTDTGEMIEEMKRCGAALAQMEERVGNQCTLPPESREGEIQQTAQSVTAKPHAILVDQSGVRYMNEGGSYMAYARGMLDRNKTVPAIPSWAIMDSQYMAKYMLAGAMPGKRKRESWISAGYLKHGDSVQQLAEQIGVNPQALTATIDRFNGFVAANCDEDFHRGERAYDRWLGDFTHTPSQTLGYINQPPFYAVEVYPGDVGTYGGVVTDEFGRVLREDGAVIGGLYAAGVSSASVMGRTYPGAGASVGPAMTWGYIAAEHASGVADS